MVSDYKIISATCPKCAFVRVSPDDLSTILLEVLESLCDLSWISKFEDEYLRKSYEVRATKTIADLEQKLALSDDGKLTKDAGEYVVSVTATETIKSQFGYKKIPLGELRGKKRAGNPGFDFHNENDVDCVLIFGEAKYQSGASAHRSALQQICEFIEDGKDIADLADLQGFCSSETLNNAANNAKGFAAAFSSKSTSTDRLIQIIGENQHFKTLQNYEEIILIAVDL